MSTAPIKKLAVILALAFAGSNVCAQSGNPEEVQRARAKGIKSRANRVYYTRKWDLSDLPAYMPEQQVSGTIRQWGSNYLADSSLGASWEEGFRKYHPGIRFDDNLTSTFIGMAGLYTKVADLAPLGRRPSWEELMAYQRVFGHTPLEITMATGSYDVAGWTFALGVFVNKQNPISQATLKQLDGIFGAARTGGWQGTQWHPEAARTAKENIRTWGQLGLTGDWKDKSIHVYGYNLNFHFPRDFAEKVFQGGYMWNEDLREYANLAKSDGSELVSAGEQFMAALSKDPYGITYTCILYMTQQTKPLALATDENGPYVELNLENVRNRTYPLTREVYYYLNHESGKALDPKFREFMRYILSREGQEAVMRDGKYLPLTAAVVAKQLRKLE
jgi:phosphate transport system substrate-binding protein